MSHHYVTFSLSVFQHITGFPGEFRPHLYKLKFINFKHSAVARANFYEGHLILLKACVFNDSTISHYCDNAVEMLQLLKVWTQPKSVKRGDVLDVGVTTSMESVEQGCNQNAVTVEEPIMWHMVGVR